MIDREAIVDALNGQRQWLRRPLASHSFLSDRFQYLFMSTPKCGSTATLVILWAIEGYPMKGWYPVKPVHKRGESDPRSSLVAVNVDVALDRLFGPKTHRFRIWRDPVDRLVSAFADLITTNEIITSDPSRDERRLRVAESLGVDDSAQISFEMFVDHVAATPDHLRDIHWRSQHRTALVDAVSFSHVIRFAHYADDMSELLDSLGAPIPAREMLEHRWKRSKREGIDVSLRLANRIREIYAEDVAPPR